MNVTITGDTQRGFNWSDGITTSYGHATPQAALGDYMARYGYASLHAPTATLSSLESCQDH